MWYLCHMCVSMFLNICVTVIECAHYCHYIAIYLVTIVTFVTIAIIWQWLVTLASKEITWVWMLSTLSLLLLFQSFENDWIHLQGKRSLKSELWKCSMWSVTNSGWGDFVDIGDRVWSLTGHWSVNWLWFGCHKLWLRGFWLWWFWFGWQKKLLG